MGEGVEQIGQALKRLFPKLKDDLNFQVTSKRTPVYNCIAWAYHLNDRWMWPYNEVTMMLDGVCYWPTKEVMEPTIDNFIAAFRLKGYEVCDGFQHEDGFRKVALYAKPGTNICTHAARELSNGFWTSKLGKLEDIQHGDPTTIENNVYGKVCCILKRVHH